MSNTTDDLLTERGKTHGDFSEHARITQDLKDIMRRAPGWARLSAIQREALEMDAHKTGRILAGDPNHQDHWDDKAGYARLVSQRLHQCPAPATNPDTAFPNFSIRGGIALAGFGPMDPLTVEVTC
jgi:hypothetical protein